MQRRAGLGAGDRSARRSSGLLGAISMRYFDLLLISVPPSFNFAEWYAGFSMPGLILLLLVAGYAFRISIGEQRNLGGALLEEEA